MKTIAHQLQHLTHSYTLSVGYQGNPDSYIREITIIAITKKIALKPQDTTVKLSWKPEKKKKRKLQPLDIYDMPPDFQI